MTTVRRIIAGLAGAAATTLAFASPALAQTPTTFDDFDALFDASLESSTAAASFATTSLLVTCCIILIVFAVNIALAVFVYKDAQKNKVDNPALWAIVTFLFTLIGLLIYFLAIRPDAIKKMEAGGGSTSSGGSGEKSS